MPTTALDVIKGAMRRIGVIATGETPSAAEAADGLAALNDVLERWNTENLAIWATTANTYTTVAGVGTYTIGPSGADWIATRPIDIVSGYSSYQGVDYPMLQYNQTQYMNIPLKTLQSTIVETFCLINGYPLGTVYLWPVPQIAATVTLNSGTAISSVSSTATTLSYPPGYALALQWALAVELSAQYGITLTNDQRKAADVSYAQIRKVNRVPSVSAFERQLRAGSAYVNWRTGW